MMLGKRSGIIVFALILAACEQKSSVIPQRAGVDLPTCQIQVHPAVGVLPANIAGEVLAPVDFSLLVTASEVVQVSGVRLKGVATSDFTLAPGTAGKSHTILIPIEEAGSHAVEVSVQSGNSSAVCQGTIFAMAQVVSGPVITAFTATPMQLTQGAAVDLNILVEGLVHSAQIAGQSVVITQGAGTLRVTPSAAGTTNYSATVTGPGGSDSRTVAVNVAPFAATFLMDGLDTTNRMFYMGQQVRIQWNSVGADSCSWGPNHLNLPNTLNGDTTIAMPNLAATHVFTCTRTVLGVPYTVSKSIGHGIASPFCYINPVTTTAVPIGGTFYFNARSALAHLSATVTGANIATFQKGAGNDQFFSFGVTVTGQTAARQVTMNMNLAPGVSATCTATGP